ncbi:acyl-CoA carboxylase epsilon subunit [Phycicoccus flavus]|uniref:acyl-CoA carboxylase epsilon subunit n=1 Tax=Phycicoccus flavus TaxID=2502783 RepID=UPI000FEBD1AB|nr:acyl-CoA carboxylase epsilon subunit [Phycicoccus flavus]NHA66751.1 acyl-CoA carboxylase subunit epsilon [Phycicoccus flavus]
MTAGADPAPEAPVIRVHGPATPEEVAALVAVLVAAGGGAEGPEPRATSTWASRRTLLRGRHDPGPAAWRSTYRR